MFIAGVVIAAGTLYAFRSALDAGAGLDESRSVALTTLVFFQLFQLVNARSLTRSAFVVAPLSNPFLLATAARHGMTRDYNKEKRRMNFKEYFQSQHWIGILSRAEAGLAFHATARQTWRRRQG